MTPDELIKALENKYSLMLQAYENKDYKTLAAEACCSLISCEKDLI